MQKIFLFLCLIQLAVASAKQPYAAVVIVGTESARVDAPNLVDLRRDLRTQAIQSLIPIYTPTSAAAIDVNLRGLIALTSFAANSTTLVVQIPTAGITQTFTGATRDESLTLFKSFLQNDANKKQLLRAYAKHSPIDPIAGNPNSLLGQMAEADYLLGRLTPLAGCDCEGSAQPIRHQFQAGAIGTRGFSKGFDTSLVTLPLRYSYSPTGSWALILDAPFSYLRNGGASSVISSLGIGFRLPLVKNWSITSLFRVGMGGTLDLVTSGIFITTGLVSEYDYKLGQFVLSLTNYAGYYSSTNFWLTGVNFNYRLQDYVFKNGLTLTSCSGFSLCERPLNLSLSFVDTYFPSGRLFIRHYDEVSLALITNYLNPCLDYDCLSLGFGYQFGQKSYRGYTLKVIYQF